MTEQAKYNILGEGLRSELKELLREVLREELANGSPKDDRLVDAPEAARLLNMSEPWLYANWKRLPFSRKIGKALKFSYLGIQKYIAKRP